MWKSKGALNKEFVQYPVWSIFKFASGPVTLDRGRGEGGEEGERWNPSVINLINLSDT